MTCATRYTATTIMELRSEISKMAGELKAHAHRQYVSLTSGCELFLRFVTRADLVSVAVCVSERGRGGCLVIAWAENVVL